MSLLIKNGRVITAVDDYKGDVFIENETVTLIGESLEMEADRVIDAKDKYVIPGGIDPHTHLDMPFAGTVSVDDFETGTRAAAHGGTTTLIDFAIQTKGRSTLEALDTWHQKAQGKTAIDYGFHMIITDLEDKRMPEMRKLADEGVTSYKLFMAYPGVLYADDGTIYRAMRKAGEDGTVICMHAENGIVIDEIVKLALAEGKTEPKWHALTRPTRMEAEGVHRAIAIAEVADVPVYIVHLSSADALEQVVLARDRGVHAFAETCPQYLLLSDAEMARVGPLAKIGPPLRADDGPDREAMWRGLEQGHTSIVSSDHSPHPQELKQVGWDNIFVTPEGASVPFGSPGLETIVSLTYSEGVVKRGLPIWWLARVMSENPARIFGLYPRKGVIQVGSDADLLIIDPQTDRIITAKDHQSNAGYTLFEGWQVSGTPWMTLLRGQVLLNQGNLEQRPGYGQFLACEGPRSPIGGPVR